MPECAKRYYSIVADNLVVLLDAFTRICGVWGTSELVSCKRYAENQL